MKTTIITCAFLVSNAILSAQTEENKPVKVRIKKVENINGVQKITDTTFTTTDPAAIGTIDNVTIVEPGGNMRVIKSYAKDGEAGSEVKIIKRGEGMDEEIEKIMKDAGVDPSAKGTKKVVIVHSDAKTGDGKGEPKTVSKVVIIKTDMNDATPGECKKAGITESKEKPVIEDLSCTPNPSNGKFNLRFSGTQKTAIEITVKDVSGKTVYTENVKHFNGSYDKEISLDGASKGVYFVTITQGSKSTSKKLIVE